MDVEESLPGAGRDLAGGLGQPAHAPDQGHHVADGHAGVQRARGQGPAGELLDRSGDLAGGGASGAPLEQQVRVLGVRGEHRPEPTQEVLETIAAGVRQRLPGLGQRLAQRQPHELVDQRVLVGETPVDGAYADPGARGDLLYAGVGTGLAEHLTGRVEDPVVVADRVAPPGWGPRPVARRGLAGHVPSQSPSSLATVSPAALSAVTASPDIARVPTAPASVAATPGRRPDR